MRTEFSGLLDPRKLGALDGGPAAALEAVWAADAADATSTPPPVASSLQPGASVESTRDVYRRALEAFTRLEATYFGTDIVLVSHGDTLSIFTAALLGTDLRSHHADYPYELGQMRVVDLTGPPAAGGGGLRPARPAWQPVAGGPAHMARRAGRTGRRGGRGGRCGGGKGRVANS